MKAEITERSDGYIMVSREVFDHYYSIQTWLFIPTTGKARKDHRCIVCGRKIEKEKERAYFPWADKFAPYRVCVTCAEEE